MKINPSLITRPTALFFTFSSARLSVFAVALLSLVSFSSGHAAEWLNETFEQYTVASPATAPTTALSPLLQFISTGTTVVGTTGNQMCRYYKPSATALVSVSHQYSLSAANATPRPMGFFSFKIVQNTPPSPAVAGSEFYLRLGSNDNTKMSASATAFIDFRFTPSVAPATTCVFSVRSGANAQSVITTVSATAQSTIKTWYNTGSVGMPYIDPAGAAQTLSAGSYVCYVNNVLASSSASGTALVSSVTTGGTVTSTTIGKLAFQCAAGSAVDFSVDDIYAADTAPVSGVAITSPTTATAQAGYPFSYTISSDGVTSPVYSTSTLPTGLSLLNGVIAGTLPTGATLGLSNITLTATGTGGPATGNLALTITAPPAAAPTITSLATASGFLTKAFTYQIQTSTTSPSSTPTSYAITGAVLLPAGLALNPTTGAITGTPNATGVTVVTYTATNPRGTSAEQTLTITIDPAPVFAWNNTGTFWTNAASWTNNAVPSNSVTGDIAAFGNLGSSATSVDVGTGRSIAGIVFNSGAYAYTWTGTDITVGGTSGITNNSTAIQTFGNKLLNAGGDPTWSSVFGGSLVFNGAIDLSTTGVSRKLTIAGAGDVTVNGVIANGGSSLAGQVYKSGTGTLRLNGANTYTGTTEVGDGTMILSAPNSSPIYRLSGYDTNISPVLKVSATNAMSSSASLSGASTVSKTGTLEFTTNGNYTLNQYAGNHMNFSNSSGSATTLTFTNATNVLSTGGGRTFANQSANLTITFNGEVDIAGNTNNTNNTCTISAVGPVVISNRVFNSNTNFIRNLEKLQTGNLTMYGVNSYNGSTIVSRGTLSIPTGGSLINCSNTVVGNINEVASTNSASLNLAGAAGVVQVSTNGFVRGGGSITSLQVQEAGAAEVAVGSTWTTRGTIDFAVGSKVSVTGTPVAGNSYTLMTASVPITYVTGSPTLVGATGWALRVDGANLLLEVAKTTPTVSVAPTASAVTVGALLSSSILSGGTATVAGATVAGTFAWTTHSTVVNATASYPVTFTPTDGANYNTASSTASVTANPAGSTYTSVGYIAGTESEIAANGLSNLMNYALGQNGPSASFPATPILSTDSNAMTLTAQARTDDSSLKFYGQWTTDLSGVTDTWENHSELLTPPNLSYSQTIDPNVPTKFIRFKVFKQ